MKRPPELIRNFNQLYDLKLSELPTKTQAKMVYEACEAVWIKQTGARFYKNYGSFQNCRSKYMNNRGKRYNTKPTH